MVPEKIIKNVEYNSGALTTEDSSKGVTDHKPDEDNSETPIKELILVKKVLVKKKNAEKITMTILLPDFHLMFGQTKHLCEAKDCAKKSWQVFGADLKWIITLY